MMRYLLTILSIVVMGITADAQINAYYVIASTGSFITTDKGSSSMTVGEMSLIQTFTGKGYVLTQGFQQGSMVRSMPTALPVTLIDFDGYNSDGVDHLIWHTASEISNVGFDIERLDAQSNFEKIGFVVGHGNSNSLQEYTFDDKQPLNGDNYYRLKQTDVDGKYTYSDVVSIFAGTSIGTSVSVYPIPVTSQLNIVIHNGEATTGSMTITNIVGENLYDGTVDIYGGTTIHQVDMSAYAPGQYFVRLTTGSTTKTIHIVRQ